MVVVKKQTEVRYDPPGPQLKVDLIIVCIALLIKPRPALYCLLQTPDMLLCHTVTTCTVQNR